MKVAVIVEGHGEVTATPILMRRLAGYLRFHGRLRVEGPFRHTRGELLREQGVERAIQRASRHVGEEDAVLLLTDADDDCPAELGPALLLRARSARPDRRIFVVVVKREYEVWFLAAAASLAGKRTLPGDLFAPDQPEEIRDAKGWLAARMDRGYAPTVEQEKLTAIFALEEARRAPSFEELVRDTATMLRVPALSRGGTDGDDA